MTPPPTCAPSSDGRGLPRIFLRSGSGVSGQGVRVGGHHSSLAASETEGGRKLPGKAVSAQQVPSSCPASCRVSGVGSGWEGEPGISVGGKLTPQAVGGGGEVASRCWPQLGLGCPGLGVQPAMNTGEVGVEWTGVFLTREEKARGQIRTLGCMGSGWPEGAYSGGLSAPHCPPWRGPQPRRQKVVETQAEGSDPLQAVPLPSCFLTKVGTQSTTRFPKSGTALGTARSCVSASCCVATPPSGRPRDGATDPRRVPGRMSTPSLTETADQRDAQGPAVLKPAPPT